MILFARLIGTAVFAGASCMLGSLIPVLWTETDENVFFKIGGTLLLLAFMACLAALCLIFWRVDP